MNVSKIACKDFWAYARSWRGPGRGRRRVLSRRRKGLPHARVANTVMEVRIMCLARTAINISTRRRTSQKGAGAQCNATSRRATGCRTTSSQRTAEVDFCYISVTVWVKSRLPVLMSVIFTAEDIYVALTKLIHRFLLEFDYSRIDSLEHLVFFFQRDSLLR